MNKTAFIEMKEFNLLKYVQKKDEVKEEAFTTSVKLKKRHSKFLKENPDIILSHLVIDVLDQLMELREKKNSIK